MGAGGQRTITIRFDGSAKGLISSATAVAAALKKVGDDTSGFKKAEAEADALSKKLDQTAKDSKEKGSLIGGGLALGLSGAAPLVGAALTGGVALGFVGVAALVQKNNKDVEASFKALGFQVTSEMKGATDQVVPYLVKAGHSLQQEFANLGPQLHTAFSFAGPDITLLTKGVDNLATNSMPGFTNAMRNSQPIVRGIATVLGDLGSTVTTVLTAVSSHSTEFGADLSKIGTLIQNIGGVAAGILPGLASGFGSTVGVANTLLGVLKPIAPALGSITGQLLPVIGSFKLFGLATSPLNKLGSKVAGVAGSFGGFTTKLTGSEEAGTKVTTATSKMGSALGKVGNALPLVGVAFGALTGIMSAAQQQTDKTLQALVDGGQAGRDATNTIAAAAPTIAHLADGFKQGESSAAQFNNALSVATKGMDPLSRATAIYNADLDRFGANSKITAGAQRNLAAASDANQGAQQRLATATQNVNAQLLTQHGILISSVDASLGYQSSVLAVQSAQVAYASAVKTSGKNSLEAKQAFITLQQAQSSETSAALNAANASHQNSSANDKAKAGTAAYTASVLTMAAATNGHMTPALKSMVGGLKAAELQSYKSTGAIKGTHQEIITLPNGKKITLTVDNKTGAPLSAAEQALRRLPSSKTVTITGRDAVTGVVNEIFRKNNGRTLNINIDSSGAEISLGHRAKGGPVAAGVPYVVGEVGKEIFVPKQAGTIIPNDQLGGSGSRVGGSTPTPLGGGDTFDLMMDDSVIVRVVDGRLKQHNRMLVRKVKSGAGAR